MEKRLDVAWNRCKDWITKFDGSATEVYIPSVQLMKFEEGIKSLCKQTNGFRLEGFFSNNLITGSIEADNNLQHLLSCFKSNKLSTLDIYYFVRVDEINLQLHIIADRNLSDLIDLDIIWWSDHVFQAGVDFRKRFADVINHIFVLQRIFDSKQIYIGPENLEIPSPISKFWIEV